jgi:hypothetical protein
MYILNSARHEKKSKTLIPDGNGKTKLWVLPATLYNKLENAKEAMIDAVEDAVAWAKKEGTFVKVHDEPSYPIKVVECTDCITIFRITDDEPED